MEGRDLVKLKKSTESEMRPDTKAGLGGKVRTSGLQQRVLRIARLARKELRESLRDRRTLATLIMMPLIVYPLLGSVIQKFAISRIDPAAPAAMVVFDLSLAPGLQELFPAPVENREELSGTGNASTNSTPAGAGLEGFADQILKGRDGGTLLEQPVRLERFPQVVGTDLEKLVETGAADVAVREVSGSRDTTTGLMTPGELLVLSRAGDAFSTKAAAEAQRRITEFRDSYVRSLLMETQYGPAAMPSVSRVNIEVSGPGESPLSAFVPLMLVLMTMTGAVYPAIDLTAGERERGTLEMLLAAPVSRRDLLTGKFFAVFTVAVLTAIINLTAMILTLYGTGFDRVILGEGVSFTTFVQVLSLLVVFASFFSAVLLSITSFARSFREAQAWLIPLMLVSLAPGILSLMPGVRLTPVLALIPLVNIVLLGKELFQGIAAPHIFVMTLAATVTYTVLALRVAATVFGSDLALFAGTSPGDRRRQHKELLSEVPLRAGIWYLIILLPLFIVLAGVRGRIVAPDNLPGQLVLSGIISVVLFAVLPVLLSVRSRVQLTSAFALRGFHTPALLGAALLGSALWPLAYEALLFGKGSLGWSRLLEHPGLKELAARLTGETPLLFRLITLAVGPAVCEELFFRGFLMSALQGKSDRWKSPLLISTLVFAAFHVVVDQTLTLERFPATFMLGLVLGWIRLSTGSVFPGIVMHVVNNGLLLSLTELEPFLKFIGLDLGVENQSHLPFWFLGAVSAVALGGAAMVWHDSPRRSKPAAAVAAG